MLLREGLRADHASRLAFAGAGGKTTAMFSLARQMTGRVVCINTAHLAVAQAALADHHVIVNQGGMIARAFTDNCEGVLLFTGPEVDNGRLAGVTPEVAEKIRQLADDFDLPVFIEADGSRMKPLKAPAAHEPPIPPWVHQVVYVAGLAALCQPLREEFVFRSKIFSELSGAVPGSAIELEHFVRFLQHPQGGLKNIPTTAKRIMLANQLDACHIPENEILSALTVDLSEYDSVLAGSLQVVGGQIDWRRERIAGIILAAGSAKRMGQVKQLLEWHGKPLVRHVVETAIQAGLDPVIVVTGAAASQVESVLQGLPVTLVHNPDWEGGQANSIRAGMHEIPRHTGGVVFLLSDMPQVPVDLIRKEVEIHRRESLAILSPRVDGQRANPVLFDRLTFTDLAALEGDLGGRALFGRFPIRWLDWNDPAILRDIDTWQDYQSLIQGDADA